MSAPFKHGDIVQHSEDGRYGRVVTTQDGYLNVEPEHFSSQEQWDATKVSLVEDPSEDQVAAVDARIDVGARDGSGAFIGTQPAPSGDPARPLPVDTTVLAHPDPAMVSSGLHQSYSALAAETGLPDAFSNAKQDYARARAAALAEGLMLSEADPAYVDEVAERVEAAKRAAGKDTGGSDQEPSAGAAGGNTGDAIPERKPRKPRA